MGYPHEADAASGDSQQRDSYLSKGNFSEILTECPRVLCVLRQYMENESCLFGEQV